MVTSKPNNPITSLILCTLFLTSHAVNATNARDYENDAQTLFSSELAQLWAMPSEVRQSKDCANWLSQSYSFFSANSYEEYKSGVRQATHDASGAGLCALDSGLAIHYSLLELKKLAKAGYLKNHSIEDAAQESFKRFLASDNYKKYENQLSKAGCNAFWPAQRFEPGTSVFTANLTIKCSAPNLHAPISFNLDTLEMRIGNKGIWNANGEHLGISLRQAIK